MHLVDSYIDRREEILAQVDEEFKESGRFRLGAFEGPVSFAYPSTDDMILAVDDKLRDPLPFYGMQSDLCSFQRAGNQLIFSSVDAVQGVHNTGRVEIYTSRLRHGRAVIIVPHWNAREDSYHAMATALCWLGFSAFVLTLPHHHARSASSTPQVANAFLNADLGVAIRSIRQSVCDVRSLATWLSTQGYSEIHLIGASLGSCVASLASAFDGRFASTSLLLTAGDFAETVWTGRATMHIGVALKPHIELAQLKRIWSVISPQSYLRYFRSSKTRLLMINGRRDSVVQFNLSSRFAEELKQAQVDLEWRVLPCGHYTLAGFPFGWLALILVTRFMRREK